MSLPWNPRLLQAVPEASTILQRANNTLPYWEAYNKNMEEYQLKYNEIRRIRLACDKDVTTYSSAIGYLHRFYNDFKVRHLLNIKEEINKTVNLWYSNDYDLRFHRTTEKGVVKTTLKDRRRGGNLELICGGAVKQTISVLFDVIFIKTSGGKFIFLDEAFNSLGEEEVKTLPDVLIKLKDMQIVLIEHKCVIIPDEFALVVNVNRDDNVGSYITVDDPTGVVPLIQAELSDQAVNSRDIEILKEFGFGAAQIEQLSSGTVDSVV